MLVAYCLLCRHCRNLAEGGCLLSRFHFTRCRFAEFTLAGPLQGSLSGELDQNVYMV